MAKEDAPTPSRPPTKRRQLHECPDRWIAEWLARNDLTAGERSRVEQERARRRSLRPDTRVALVVDHAGVTPPQFERLTEFLASSNATEIHHAGVSSPVHQACKRLGVPVHAHDGGHLYSRNAIHREIIRDVATTVIAAPKETHEPTQKTGVWDVIRFAKHRNLPVRVVMPDGHEQGEK